VASGALARAAEQRSALEAERNAKLAAAQTALSAALKEANIEEGKVRDHTAYHQPTPNPNSNSDQHRGRQGMSTRLTQCTHCIIYARARLFHTARACTVAH
jgi:hypothetical protein